MRTDCGGCRGEGAHWRWCPEVVGRSASYIGQLSAQAEDLADAIASNETGAANHAYQAGALLRAKADEMARQWKAVNER